MSGTTTSVSHHEMEAQLHAGSSIKHVIGVMSGKGGVGKSMVTSLLAVQMREQGFHVGILDADITGPSIPKSFGLKGRAQSHNEEIYPVETAGGIKVMSINLLLADTSDPVIWRGPLVGGAVRQFWSDVVWGELDYLFIDLPPGTGDVPLTVFQSLRIDGIVVVTSPQELVGMIVAKAVKMAEKMNVPILGLVENMAYFACPDCGSTHAIFGPSHIEDVAKEHDLPVLGRLPLDPSLAQACDKGQIETDHGEYGKVMARRLPQ